MKPAKSNMSMRSVRSMKSLNKLSISSHRAMVLEFHVDFVKELSDACQKFECFGIQVKKGSVNDAFYKSLKTEQKKIAMTKRISLAAVALNTADEVNPARLRYSSESTSTQQAPSVDPVLAVVEALYDPQDELVEVIVSKAKDVPRKLLQCIAILAPHFRFLVKISIVNSKINGYTIHELQKMLRYTAISDVCLDGTSLCESNYWMLLSEKSKLRYLSLSRCRINDDAVRIIALNLHYKAPSGKTLMALNLSCNFITDEGAQQLALALRSNRCLRYLNLASNLITDDGALPLFDTLKEFPILSHEIIQKRKRRMDYLRKKRAIYMKYFEDAEQRDEDTMSRKTISSRKSKVSGISPKKSKKDTGDVDLITKAEILSLEILGLFSDPYGPEQVKIKDGVTYCLGNLVLCYLNLGYNSLSYLSIARLQAVLLYQSSIKKPSDYGLLRVVVEGNLTPVNCSEFDVIGQSLTNSVFRQMGAVERRRASTVSRKK